MNKEQTAIMGFISENESAGLFTEREWIDEEFDHFKNIESVIEGLIESGVLVENDVFITTPAALERIA